jgi:AraC-like DNA-binding protein
MSRLVTLAGCAPSYNITSFYIVTEFRAQTQSELPLPSLLLPKTFSNEFNVCIIRTGYAEHYSFRSKKELHVGRVLLSKPGCEFQIKFLKNQPEVATIFRFSNEFYSLLLDNYKQEFGWFLHNVDLPCLLLATTPNVELLCRQIVSADLNRNRLHADELMLELLDSVLHTHLRPLKPITAAYKKLHLNTVEKARDYILHHYKDDMGVQALAEHCCVSVFHFARIFKDVMKMSPYQYLLEVRLQHAYLLIRNSKLSIAEVALQSGFKSPENFSTAYRIRFGHPPSASRNHPNSKKSQLSLRAEA